MKTVDYNQIATKYINSIHVSNLCNAIPMRMKIRSETSYSRFHKYTVKAGMTKIALIHPVDKNVIKIPFIGDSGAYSELYAGSINSLNIGYDYCAREVDLYNKAVDQGFSDAFVKVVNVGTHINKSYKYQPTINIYLQEKVDKVGIISVADYSKESMKKLVEYQKDSKYEFDMDEPFGAAFIDYYGEDYGYDLFQFIEKEQIDDLHSGNFGYLHNRPVVIDYGGYNH